MVAAWNRPRDEIFSGLLAGWRLRTCVALARVKMRTNVRLEAGEEKHGGGSMMDGEQEET